VGLAAQEMPGSYSETHGHADRVSADVERTERKITYPKAVKMDDVDDILKAIMKEQKQLDASYG